MKLVLGLNRSDVHPIIAIQFILLSEGIKTLIPCMKRLRGMHFLPFDVKDEVFSIGFS